MNWLNLRTEILHSPEFIGSDPIRRATWLSLSLWCAQQENGGRIVGGAKWPDRRWQQTAGVTADEATDSCELFAVVNDDVVVWGYPIDRQEEIKAKREAGRSTVAKRWGKKGVDSSAINSATSSADTERNRKGIGIGKEGEGVQGKEAGTATPPAAPQVAAFKLDDPAPPATPPKPKRKPAAPAQTEAEWMTSLAASPAYAGINIATEHAKASEWCRVRQRSLSRQRFINWLNRADKPLTASNGSTTSRRSFSDSNDYSAVKF